MLESLEVLVVDDDAAIRRILSSELQTYGMNVATASSAAEARKALQSGKPDVMVLDIRMPGVQGDVFLKEVPALVPDLPVIILTGHANVDLAVQCMKDGAVDLLTKPCSVEQLQLAIKRASDTAHLREANRSLIREVERPRRNSQELIGSSRPMKRLREMIQRVADTDEPVLIVGESGTGKELIAQSILANSRRSRAAFITVNCAAVTETLLESELFGHEKGAFSGADEKRLGFFELAHEGTIFLDEIGDMPLSMQPKLLRVLQSGEFRRVGGNRTLSADVRVIAATNKSLLDEVREGRFREDLMHRINTFVLEAPALRERIEDLEELIAAFLVEINGRQQDNKRFSDEAIAVMQTYNWPGNVRELRNIVRRSLVLSSDKVITGDDLPRYLTASDGKEDAVPAMLDLTLGELERRHILAVIDDCGGNKTQAAKRLGVSVKTLYNKFESWGLKEV